MPGPGRLPHIDDHRRRSATPRWHDVYPYRSWWHLALRMRGSCIKTHRRAKVSGREDPRWPLRFDMPPATRARLCASRSAPTAALLVGTGGGVIKTWGILSGEVRVGFLQDAADEIDVLALAPDGNTIAAWGDGKVSIQRLGDERKPTVVMSGAGKGHSLAFSPDGRTLAGGGDGCLVLWDTDSGREKVRIENQGGGIDALAFTSDGGTPLRSPAGHAR